MKVVALIPTYNPDERLCQVIDGLITQHFEHIIVVDDGSRADCSPIFERISQYPQCHLLKHAVNCGKGRALKTGLNYFYLNFPSSPGVVTADGDGQHLPSDIHRVAEALEENPGKLIIGTRQWGGDVPFRSKFGNVLTKFIFALLVGRKLNDTQSGLRGIHRNVIPTILTLKGERYEYEMNMLIGMKINGIKITEVPIDTIYIENNKASHFNPLIDSMKIYFLLFRFMFSSLFSAFIDFITFLTIHSVSGSIFIGIVIARCMSGVVNYLVNKNIVFKDKHKLLPTLLKFALLLTVRGFVSFILIDQAVQILNIHVRTAYLIVETSLFITSFTIQRDLVFYSEERED